MFRGERVAGRFEILGEARRGGMGTVFRALDRKEKRDVALKVLNAEAGEVQLRFEREAVILAGLKHPNIVEYITHGVNVDGSMYLVMEWVEGENLSQRLERVGLDAAETVAMGIQVARALAGMHAAGVVHRDLKPSNLMLVDRDVARVKLVDFGIARRSNEGNRLTSTGALVGTAGYMSPEQARGDNLHVDARSDLFALGCVVHECLTGEAPFQSDSLLAARAKVLVETPANLREFNPYLPAELDALVASLLSRRPLERPQDAAAVERALAALADLPPGRPVRRMRRASQADRGEPTMASGPPTVATAALDKCAVLVAVGDDPVPTVLMDFGVEGAMLELLDGGLVVTLTGQSSMAGRIALRLAERLPHATIAVIASDTIDDAIDRCARVIEDAQIQVGIDGDATARGAWTDAATAPAIERELQVEHLGTLRRLVGAGDAPA
jgi:hypothetical protein